jgi:hypothetical protein
MTARCIACNNFLFWDEKEIKKQPGFRPKCNCGGAADVMVSSGLLRGQHPYYPEKTFYSEGGADPYFYAYKNNKGECFVYYQDKVVKVENPVLLSK